MRGPQAQLALQFHNQTTKYFLFLSKESRYSGMARQLRELAARAKDLGSIPGAHTVEGDSPWIVF